MTKQAGTVTPRQDGPDDGSRRPWYREPMVWLVIAIPLTSVIMGLVLLRLALVHRDGLVVDDYYWQGKTINRVLARDRRASELGLASRLELSPDRGLATLSVRAGRDVALPATLEVKLLHATRAGQDKVLRMERVGDGTYRGALPPLEPGRWDVQVGTDEWRLVGWLQMPGATAARIEPAAHAGDS